MNIKYNKALWLIIILAIVMMIPFLGLTDFNTKGEPREAVVAYTMLEHGNWILPINNGGDIPYKPPFFHWCIAFFSLFIGHVNEYTSRLPSALSLVKAQAKAALEATTNALKEALIAGDKIQLVGFGTFSINERPAREGINPATKEKIQIAAKKVAKFKAGAELADAINK